MNKEMNLNGFKQNLPAFNKPLMEIFDISMDIDMDCDEYELHDQNWIGPRTIKQLRNTSERLRNAYMEIAALTGLDPCEQFDETKKKIKIMYSDKNK